MSDTIIGGLPGDLISGSVGDDTLFGDYDHVSIILDNRLWRIVRRVGGATVVDGVKRRLIEVEEV